MGAYVGGALQGVASGMGSPDDDKKRKKRDDEHNIKDSMKTPGFYGSTVTSYKRGGKVHKTGMALLHKGERVLTKKQARKRGRKRD